MNILKKNSKRGLGSKRFPLQSKAIFWLLSITLIGGALSGGSSTSAAAANKIGSFVVVAGSVDALREQMEAPIAAEIGMDAYLDDVVRTKRRSRTQLRFIDNSVLNMGSDHMVKIKDYVYDEKNGVRRAILSSLRGTVRVTVAKLGVDTDSVFEVETPTAVASVRGTDFIVKVDNQNQTQIIVLEGAVLVRNVNPKVSGTVMVTAGNKTTIPRGGPPTPAVQVPPQIQELLITETTPTPVASTDTPTARAQGGGGAQDSAPADASGGTPQSPGAPVAADMAPMAPPPQLPIAPPGFTPAAPTVVATGDQGAAAGPPPALPPVQPPVTALPNAVPVLIPVTLNLVF